MATIDEIRQHNEELADRTSRAYLDKMGRFAAAVRQATPVARTTPPNVPAPRTEGWWSATMQKLRADNPTMTHDELNSAAYMLSRMPAAPAAPPPSDPPSSGKPPMSCPPVALATLTDSKPAAWNQIAKQGRFVKDGVHFTLDTNVFSDIIRNFHERIPVDFEHATEAPASAGSIPRLGAPAQGWITRLELRNGDLWGLVEWGELARQYIKEGSYRSLSPAVWFGAKDKTTGQDIGARLSSVALTNVPFLTSMQPLAASDVPKSFQSEYTIDVAGVTHGVPKPYQTTKRPPRLARDPKNGGIAIIDMGELDTQDKDRLLKSIADFNAEQKKLRDNFRTWAKDSGLNVDMPEEA